MSQLKFPAGTHVLIDENIVGVVLYGYNMFTPPADPFFIYRIIVDAGEIIYRVLSKQINQRGDEILLREDMDNLLTATDRIAVIEVSEDRLIKYNYLMSKELQS